MDPGMSCKSSKTRRPSIVVIQGEIDAWRYVVQVPSLLSPLMIQMRVLDPGPLSQALHVALLVPEQALLYRLDLCNIGEDTALSDTLQLRAKGNETHAVQDALSGNGTRQGCPS